MNYIHDFIDRYNAIRVVDQNVYDLNKDDLAVYLAGARRATEKSETMQSLIVRVVCIILLVSSPSFIAYCWVTIASTYSANRGEIHAIVDHIVSVPFGMIPIAIVAISSYTIFFPLVMSTIRIWQMIPFPLWLSDRIQRIADQYQLITCRHPFYWIIMPLLIYVLLLLLVLQAYDSRLFPIHVLSLLGQCVIVLPFVALSVVPSFSFLVISIALLGRYTEPTHYAPRIAACYYLMELYQTCSKIGSTEELLSVKEAAKKEIIQTAHALEVYANRFSDDNLRARVKEFAQRVRALSTWVSFPRNDTPRHLRIQVLHWLNALLRGEDDIMLNSSLGGVLQTESRSWLQRIGFFTASSLYILAPLVGYAVAVNSGITLDDPLLRTVMPIGYFAWMAIAALFSFEKFAPEYKTYLVDIFKAVLGR